MAQRLDAPQRLLTWVYRKLGSNYPAAFVTLEFQSAFFITVGTLALFAFYYDASKHDFAVMVIGGLSLTFATVLIALIRTYRYVRPINQWISGRRDPEHTAKAWACAVGFPLEIIRRDMWLPIVGVALPGSIGAIPLFDLGWVHFFPIFFGALVAIGYSGILHYFAIEAGMRPVVIDMSRELPPRLGVPGQAIPLRFKLMAALPMINIITGLTAAALSSSGEGGEPGIGVDVLIATAVAFAISLELSILLSKSILRPLGDLQKGIDAVRQGRYDVAVPVTTADELGELSAGFNQMVDGLAERERIREAFGTYLDKEVAEYILSEGYQPEGFEVDVTVLFCDVKDFTSFSASADAEEVVASLNKLFETVVPIVARHGGHVDKFIGDGLLAVFGAPESFSDHADRAVAAAVEMAERVNHGGDSDLGIGIGVNSGPVIAGSIGGGGRLNFSVIGDPVNVAARVESLTREFDDDVLITEETRKRLSETIEVESRGEQEIRGKDEPIEVFAPTVRTREHLLPR